MGKKAEKKREEIETFEKLLFLIFELRALKSLKKQAN